jgi:hypothetical protein
MHPWVSVDHDGLVLDFFGRVPRQERSSRRAHALGAAIVTTFRTELESIDSSLTSISSPSMPPRKPGRERYDESG